MSSAKLTTDAGGSPNNQGAWLITFSDMVTLLLTFFVLIIAITSVDPRVMVSDGVDEVTDARIQEVIGPGVMYFSNPTLLDPIVSLVEHMDEIPPDANLNQDEIKAAIFQLDPNDINPEFKDLAEEIDSSVTIIKDDRGFVIRWNDSMLFPEGGTILKEENLILLARLAQLLAGLSLPVSLECHTNPLSELEGGETPLAFDLSAERAKIVLDFFVALGLNEARFRLGAFGPSRPISMDPKVASDNSRLEIVIYKPPKTSWKG
jgi:chemotaxis protein MotB